MRYQVYKIINSEKYLNLALKNLKRDDISAITIRTYGVIQNYYYLEFVVDQITERKKIDEPTKLILMMAVYEKLFLNNTPDYVIISEYQKLTKKVNAKSLKYVSYILHNKLADLTYQTPHFKDEIKNLSITYSHPKWLVKLLKQQYPNDYELIMSANNKQKPLTARVIKPLENKDNVKFIYDDFIELTNSLHQNTDFLNNNIIIQDLGSYLVSKYVGYDLDAEVLDLCAAPGNKTIHLSTRFKKVYANEINPKRFNLLNNNIEKYGIINSCTFNSDAASFSQLNEQLNNKKFDYILVDAPCSGLGTLRSKPELRLRITNQDIIQVQDMQYDIFKNALNFLSEDGYITYSTCSINESENENQIARFIKEFDLEEVIDEEFKQFDDKKSTHGITLLPYKRETDGFFMCKLKRK